MPGVDRSQFLAVEARGRCEDKKLAGLAGLVLLVERGLRPFQRFAGESVFGVARGVNGKVWGGRMMNSGLAASCRRAACENEANAACSALTREPCYGCLMANPETSFRCFQSA